MSRSNVTVTVGMSPAPGSEERAYASEKMLREADHREELIAANLRRLPVPTSQDFWKRVALQAAEIGEGLSPVEVVTVAARRELRVEFTIYPRRAAWHRRLNTRRWRFARDGAL